MLKKIIYATLAAATLVAIPAAAGAGDHDHNRMHHQDDWYGGHHDNHRYHPRGSVISYNLGWGRPAYYTRYYPAPVYNYVTVPQPVYVPTPVYYSNTIVNNTSYCREFTRNIVVGGVVQQGYGNACRQPDGSWQIIDD